MAWSHFRNQLDLERLELVPVLVGFGKNSGTFRNCPEPPWSLFRAYQPHSFQLLGEKKTKRHPAKTPSPFTTELESVSMLTCCHVEPKRTPKTRKRTISVFLGRDSSLCAYALPGPSCSKDLHSCPHALGGWVVGWAAGRVGGCCRCLYPAGSLPQLKQ